MKDKREFFALLADLDGHPVSDYSRLLGDFDFGRFVLRVNRIVSDEGLPSLFMVRVPQHVAGFPHHLMSSPVRRTGLEDYLTRQVASVIERFAHFGEDGVARRRLQIAAPGQKILPRTALLATDEQIEARLRIHMPALDGKVAAGAARDIFLQDLPELVTDALLYCNLDQAALEEFVNLMEDADQVRQALPTRGLVSFVREGSLLPRLGRTDLPELLAANPLVVADSARVELETPNAGSVRGLGIPGGITLILGDDTSGRPELLKAIAAGIYNHVPGDGREMVITVPDAVHVPAEAGRSVQRVDVSAFVDAGPESTVYRSYTSADATASLSQAAGLVEALEVGARALVLDESDSAPSFLSVDSRIAGFAAGGSVRPHALASRARQLADELGVSIVIGGCSAVGNLVPVADHIYAIRDFEVRDVTEEARKSWTGGVAEAPDVSSIAALVEKSRWVVPGSIDASQGTQDVHLGARSTRELLLGRQVVDLSMVSQLADMHQTATIGLIIHYAKLRYMEEGRPLREILDLVDRDLSTEGLESLSREQRGDLARPRRYEIAAALNRMRSLRISTPAE